MSGQEALAAWQFGSGKKPFCVRALERLDKDGVVYVRYTLVDDSGQSHRKNEVLEGGFIVRNEKGQLIAKRVAKAQVLVEEMSATLRASGRMTARAARNTHSVLSAPAATVRTSNAVAGGDITLRNAFDLWLQSGAETRDRVDARAQANEICRTLGGSIRVASLKREDVKVLWRAMYHEWEPHVPRGAGGPVLSKRAVSRLFTCVRWLRDNHYTDEASIHPWDRWRNELDNEWRQYLEKESDPRKRIAGLRKIDTNGGFKVRRERFEHWEFGRLLRTAYAGGADPRICALVVLGAELRMEVVSRAMRSQLLMPDQCEHGDEIRSWEFDSSVTPERLRALAPHGILRIFGSGNKKGDFVVLTKTQGEHISRVLTTGYLRELESAYHSGDIEDYPLICGAKLSGVTVDQVEGGVIRFESRRGEQSLRPMVRRCLPPHLLGLQTRAGVQPVPGRGLRGMRRVAADLASELEASSWVKDALGFWTTRKEVYTSDHAKLLSLRHVAAFRGKVRNFALRAAAKHDAANHRETNAHV